MPQEIQEIDIHRAQATDLEGAAQLAGCLVRQHHAADPCRFFLPDGVESGYAAWFRRELGRSEAVLLVARRGSELLGYAYGALEDRDWNLLLDRHGAIHDLYVIESARQLGIGRRLFQAMLAELTALGAPRIVLSTMVGNEAAQRLFRACGFRPTLLEMTRDAPTSSI
jgi:ribosomal protein S18 acetylase RimI-like enzyme